MADFLSHPFIVLAMSLRPPEAPRNPELDPILQLGLEPKSPLRQTFEQPEQEDRSKWPLCPKCEKPFSSELALRHHLASQFHRHTEHEKQSPSLLIEGEKLVEPEVVSEEKAESWICPLCTEDKVFSSALAYRMHQASGNHSREKLLRSPTQVEALPTWVKPTWSPVKETPPVVEQSNQVEEALKTICAEIAATKRVTFSDSMLSKIDTDIDATQILVLSATRDLAVLVDTLLAPRCAGFGITTYACVGGRSVQDDKISLSEGPHIVSGTPGRVSDMIRRRVLMTDDIRLLVLNKEEMLLNRSMWPQLAAVYGLLDPETKIVRASVRVREGTS